jgi:hypothetical protein
MTYNREKVIEHLEKAREHLTAAYEAHKKFSALLPKNMVQANAHIRDAIRDADQWEENHG